jgi:hypothetical protein
MFGTSVLRMLLSQLNAHGDWLPPTLSPAGVPTTGRNSGWRNRLTYLWKLPEALLGNSQGGGQVSICSKKTARGRKVKV